MKALRVYMSAMIFLASYVIMQAGEYEIDGIKYSVNANSGTAQVIGYTKNNVEDNISIVSAISEGKKSYPVTSIKTYALKDLSCKKLTIPANIMELEGNCFRDASIDSLIIEDSDYKLNLPEDRHISTSSVTVGFAFCGSKFKYVYVGRNLYVESGYYYNFDIYDGSLLYQVTYYAYIDKLAVGGSATFFRAEKDIIANKIEILPSNGSIETYIGAECDSITINRQVDNGRYSNARVVIFESNVDKIEKRILATMDSVQILRIPEKVAEIDAESLKNLHRLYDIQVDERNLAYASHQGSLYSKDMTLLLMSCKYKTTESEITLPSTVNTIGNNAFMGVLCEKVIAPNVKKVGYKAFYNSELRSFIGENLSDVRDSAFTNTHINNIALSNRQRVYIGKDAFAGCKDLVQIHNTDNIASIGDGAFDGCKELKTVRLGQTLERVGERAFRGCESITDINLSSPAIKEIGESAFENCRQLQTVTYGQAIERIGDKAFSGCESLLTDVNMSLPELKEIGRWAYADCKSLQRVNLNSMITAIPAGLFYNCTSLQEVIVPDNLNAIADSAFYNNRQLNKIEWGKNLEFIGKSSFYRCSSLAHADLALNSISYLGEYAFECSGLGGTVVLSDNISNIKYGTFARCNKIESIIMSKNIAKIDTDAFAGCTAMSKVTFGEGLTEIGGWAFSGCSSLTDINFENAVNLKSIGYSSFGDCNSIVSIKLNDSLQEIDKDAFSGCSRLEDLILGSAIRSIGNYAFYSCPNLKNIYINKDIADISAEYRTFDQPIYASATLYIPCGEEVLRSYQTYAPWRYFYDIRQTEEMSGTDSVAADGGSEEPAVYYDLNGRRVDSPAHGVYIRRQGTRTAKVVM